MLNPLQAQFAHTLRDLSTTNITVLGSRTHKTYHRNPQELRNGNRANCRRRHRSPCRSLIRYLFCKCPSSTTFTHTPPLRPRVFSTHHDLDQRALYATARRRASCSIIALVARRTGRHMPYVHTDVLNSKLLHLPETKKQCYQSVRNTQHSHKNEMAHILRLDRGCRGHNIGKVLPN